MIFAEIGALLSPVISGALRNQSGWGAALLLDRALLATSCVLVLAIRRTSLPAR